MACGSLFFDMLQRRRLYRILLNLEEIPVLLLKTAKEKYH